MMRRVVVPEYVPKAKKVVEESSEGAAPLTDADTQAEIAKYIKDVRVFFFSSDAYGVPTQAPHRRRRWPKRWAR
jgi:hypothetical protein